MVFRQLAKKHKMPLEEFGRHCETHREFDQELDDAQLEILQKGNAIVEGRLAGWLAHRNNISAIKVVIDADLKTRAKRIMKREKGTMEQREREIGKREKSEELRYKNYYNIDLKDTSIYDLVIDSTDKTAEETADIILKHIEN